MLERELESEGGSPALSLSGCVASPSCEPDSPFLTGSWTPGRSA